MFYFQHLFGFGYIFKCASAFKDVPGEKKKEGEQEEEEKEK